MEIEPVPVTQIQRGRDGREYEVSGLAGHIAKQVCDLDASLRVRFNETDRDGGYFVIYQLLNAGRLPVERDEDAVIKTVVMRVPMHQWDGRVIKELEPRAWDIRHGISRADVLDADDARRQADSEYALDQEVKTHAYSLMRAMQRDWFNMNPSVFISSGLSR